MDAHIIITDDLEREVKDAIPINFKSHKVEITDLNNGICFVIVKVKWQTITKKNSSAT